MDRVHEAAANHLHAVFVYSVDQKRRQVTDGMSDALYPLFDRNGKYLYFTASTDVGLSAVGFDMSSIEHPVTRSVYVVVLDKDLPSPLAPESDEEKVGDGRRPSRRRPTHDKTEGREGEGEAGRREDRLRRHRPANPRAAGAGAQLREACCRARAACCSSARRRSSSARATPPT